METSNALTSTPRDEYHQKLLTKKGVERTTHILNKHKFNIISFKGERGFRY